jgi:hypothetical protein
MVEVSDVSANSSSHMMESHEYTVQSLVSSPVGEADEIQGDISLRCCFNSRIRDAAMENMVEKVGFLPRKRNLEGNSDIPTDMSNSFYVLSNNEIMVHAIYDGC